MEAIDVSTMPCFKPLPGRRFLLLTDKALEAKLRLEDSSQRYESIQHIAAENYQECLAVIEANGEATDFLVAAPGVYFKSPDPQILGPSNRLAVLACNSTPTSQKAVLHFLKQAAHTASQHQSAVSDRFFDVASAAECLRFVDHEYGCEATFQHMDERLEWHEQLGELAPGEQQLLPSGEISVLAVGVFNEDIHSHLEVNGKLVLRGQTIVHSGSPSFVPADQQRLFEAFLELEEQPLILNLEGGQITSITAPHGSQRSQATLEAMMAVDSRYKTLLEIGFGINTNLELFPGNSAMNEVYGGDSGVVHFGLGLTPYTQFHLDFLCPHTSVMTPCGRTLLGKGAQWKTN